MSLNPQHHPIPPWPQHPSLVLQRQHLQHNQADYQAVMQSQELLRIWSDSPWPEDDFSLQQNAEDLQMHIDDFEQQQAYGFSVFSSQQQFLGSVYLEPVAPFIDNYQADPQTKQRLALYDVRVEYWLRQGTSSALEIELVQTLNHWLKQSWWFKAAVWGSRKGMQQRRALYQSLGFTEVAALLSNDATRRFHFHAP